MNSIPEDSESGVDSMSDDLEQGTDSFLKNSNNKMKRKSKQISNAGYKKPKKDQESKLTKRELYKAPTADELNRLRETENLFNSNLFRLQIEELLKEVSVRQKYKQKFGSWLQNFRHFLNNIPEYDIALSDVSSSSLSDLDRSFKNKERAKQIKKMKPVDIKSDKNANVKFLRPAGFDVVGAYKINAGLGPSLSASVNVTIPKIFFHEKDYLNNRYIVKRSLYLSYLTVHLQESRLTSKIEYSLVDGAPVLIVLPNLSEKIEVVIFVTPEEDTFKLSRFVPNMNNLRHGYCSGVGSEDKQEGQPTPFYNSLLLKDLTFVANENFIRNSVMNLPEVCSGLRLLRVWTRQRGLQHVDDLVISFCSHLVKTGKLNKFMSSYQIVRNIWAQLSQSNWNNSGISLSDKSVNLKDYHDHFDVVVLDCTGYYNLAFLMTTDMYIKLKTEATTALACLDGPDAGNSFKDLFMVPLDFYVQYDTMVIIENREELHQIYNNAEVEERSEYSLNMERLLINKIVKVLRRGLTNRITAIVPYTGSKIRWSPGEKCGPSINRLVFGLMLDQSQAFQLVDRGPEANDSSASEFRNFWGEKAELRRFKDASICEAVFWKADTVRARRKIVGRIVQYVLRRHFELSDITVIGDQLAGTDEESVLDVINAYNDLSKKLRALDLPLGVAAVHGLSPVFSYSDPYPPVAKKERDKYGITDEKDDFILLKENARTTPQLVPAIEVVFQLALTSKWPNDLEAVRHLKSAFYVRMLKQFLDKFQVRSVVRRECLDVLIDGLIFRLFLFYTREPSLLKKNVTELGVTTYHDTPESILLEENLDVRPKLVGALSGLHARYPAFGPSSALVKRWFNSQLLDSSHISELATDLLMAYLHLSPSLYVKPSPLPQIMLFRFLELLTSLDFKLQPIVVNFNDELTKDKLAQLEAEFQQDRASYPPLTLITPFDKSRVGLFYRSPTKEVLHRIRLLANESCRIMKDSIYQSSFSVDPLFVANLNGYNALLHLNEEVNPRSHQNVIKDFALPKVHNKNAAKNKVPVVDFNPVELYLKELRECYGEYALFFHNLYGGNVIAILWKPEVFSGKDFKASHVNCRKLVNGDRLEFNPDVVLEDFFVMGNGLVKSIEKLTD